MRATSVKNNILVQLVTFATSAVFLASCDASEPTSLRGANSDATIWLSPDRPVPAAPLQIAASSSQTSSANTTSASLPPIMSLTAGEVCEGVKFRDSSGIVRTGSLDCSITLCVANGATGCKITGTLRSVDKSAIEASKDKMTTSATIVGVQGTFNPGAYQDCSQSTQVNCTTTNDLPAMNQGDVHPGVIKTGTQLGPNLTGAYPSGSYPLTGYIGTKAQLNPTNLKVALGSTAGYQFWDYKGAAKNLKGHANFKASNILVNKNIYGVGGTAPEAAATDCTAERQSDCFMSPEKDFVAIDTTKINAGIIKKGVEILGVTGDYPSNTYRLNGDSAMPDLDLSNYDQLSRSDTYEYFDSEGNRHTVIGNAELKPESIKKDITLFGHQGTVDGVDLSGVSPYDLRAGVAGIGKMDPNATCASKDDCVGAGKLWQDVSVSNGEAQDCGSGSVNCYFYNAMLKQVWHFALKAEQLIWVDSANSCESSNNGNKSDWRLPTQKETLIASVHGLGKLGIYGFYDNSGSDRAFWTSTANSYNKTSYGRIAYSHVNDAFITGVVTTKKDIVCVHDAP